MKLTDEQIIEALAENGHDDEAAALAEKLTAAEGGEESAPSDEMNSKLRAAAGR